MEFEAVIGLEVHAQLLSKTKIFCSCSTEYGKPPNSLTCPVCLGMPGVLPVLNRQVVEYSMKTALAMHCRIRPYNQFARKNYFYPDLPKGYQISQYELPIAEKGFVEIETAMSRQPRRIGITRIHMEEDAGKLVHELDGAAPDTSYVDFNRTGVPLMEIVSEPDMRTPGEAGEYLKTLRSIVQYLDVCDGNMEQGSFRCDANVSLRRKGESRLGTRVELKNMNSFRHVTHALEYEICRQKELLEDGEQIAQETRLWDERRGITVSMRSKEEAHDYRYFPDPDLVPLTIDEAWVERIREQLPELPREKAKRFVAEYGIPEYDAQILTTTKQLADYFEKCAGLYGQPKKISNWIMGDVLRNLGDSREITGFAVSPRHLAAMLKMIDAGIISGKIAKTVFEEMRISGRMPEEIVREKGLVQVSDTAELEKTVRKVLADNDRMVEEFRNGKEKLFGFFVGQAMKATGGKANPKVINDILRRLLAGEQD